jgi:hypothetical protein
VFPPIYGVPGFQLFDLPSNEEEQDDVIHQGPLADPILSRGSSRTKPTIDEKEKSSSGDTGHGSFLRTSCNSSDPYVCIYMYKTINNYNTHTVYIKYILTYYIILSYCYCIKPIKSFKIL